MTQAMIFKLDQNPNGRGLRCDADGLFFAGEALLERDGENQFRPRQPNSIQKLLSATYGVNSDWASRIRSVDVVAKALNKGDMARAMMAAVLMRLPEPSDAVPIASTDGSLAKAGFNSAERRDERGRWTSGGGGTASNMRTQLAQALVEPFVEPLIEPFVEEPVKPVPMPAPSDIVPPTMGPRGFRPVPPFTNPYPNDPDCVEEWENARKYCNEQRRSGRLKWSDSRRYLITYDQCVRGQVREACGGTAVEYRA
jgi:hypothetical protein